MGDSNLPPWVEFQSTPHQTSLEVVLSACTIFHEGSSNKTWCSQNSRINLRMKVFFPVFGCVSWYNANMGNDMIYMMCDMWYTRIDLRRSKHHIHVCTYMKSDDAWHMTNITYECMTYNKICCVWHIYIYIYYKHMDKSVTHELHYIKYLKRRIDLQPPRDPS